MFEVESLPIKRKEIVAIKDKIPSNIKNIGAVEKWRQGYKGKGVIIAVLDTGCDTSHIDLQERIIDGMNFTTDSNGDPNNYEDLHGHGTHVAGSIAGSLNGEGIVGVAPEVKMLVIKVLDKNGGGSLRSLIDGIDYAMNWKGEDNEVVSAISLSLGAKEGSNELHRVVKEAGLKGIFVVTAAGNDGMGTSPQMNVVFLRAIQRQL